MNMQHYSELKQLKGFDEKPWLVMGTGPSMTRIEQKKLKSFNLWTINHAILYAKHAQVISATDWLAIKEITQPGISGNALITRNAFNNGEYLKAFTELYPKIAVYCVEYAEDLAQIKGTKRLFPQHDLLPRSCSSSMAFLVLGLLGVKTIHVAGLDGGKGSKHPMFSNTISFQRTISANIDYDLHNRGAWSWAEAFGITIIR